MPNQPQPCAQVLISQELSTFLNDYSKDHRYWKWIYDMKETLLYNRLAGESIQKRLIPDKYKKKYGVNHLYRYSHPEDYRSCYIMLSKQTVGICCIILDLLDHDEYTDLFGYTG